MPASLPPRSDELPVLFAAPRSGYAYKVALTLRLLGMPHALECIDLSVPRAERRVRFRSVARFDEVPVLLIDGVVLCQSNAICEYLARRQSALQESDESQRLRVREWLYWETERLGLNLAHTCAARHFGTHPAEVAQWYEQRVAQDLAHMAGVLAAHPFLVGEVPTIADVACYAWLPYAQALGLFDGLAPPLAAWQARIEALPGFAAPVQVFAAEVA